MANQQPEDAIMNQAYKSLFENFPYPAYLLKVDSLEIVAVNPAAEQKGIHQGNKCHQATHNEPGPCHGGIGCPLQDVVETGNVCTKEHIHIDQNGNEYIVDVTGVPVKAQDQKVTHIFEIAVDISEQYRYQHNFHLLAEAVKRSQDGFIIIDDKKQAVFVNEAYRSLTGIEATFELSRDMNRYFHNDVKDVFAEVYDKVIDGHSVVKKPVTWLHEGEAEVHLFLSAESLLLNNRHYAIITLSDISETIEQQRQLLRAKESAEQANRAKTIFLANISHDIRTPLNGIIAASDYLIQTISEQLPQSKGVGDFLNRILFSGKVLQSIFDDLLQITKIEAGAVPITLKPFELKKTIEMLAESFHTPGTDAKLVVNIDDQLPDQVIGDSTHIIQVLLNLVSNARKFAANGLVALIISLEEEFKDTGEILVRYRVIDSGIGIPEESQDSIFEIFNQGKDETKHQYGGSGLGLSIVSNLIKLMQGEYGIESPVKPEVINRLLVNNNQSEASESLRLGPGTEIWFTLKHQRVQKTAQSSATENNYEHLKGISVIIAEDNEVNEKLLTAILGRLQITCFVARDGLEAISLYQEQKNQVAAALLDINMPHLSGIKVAMLIRSDENYNDLPRLPVIAVTAHAHPDDFDTFKEAGIDYIVSKPFTMQDIAGSLTRALKG